MGEGGREVDMWMGDGSGDWAGFATSLLHKNSWLLFGPKNLHEAWLFGVH